VREGFEVADDEISEEGRRVRFAQWEKLGLDEIKQDLATGGYRLVGGPPAVRQLAREWARMKEAEQVRAASEAMGLSKNPALDPMGLRSSSLYDPLSGDGPGTFKYALRPSADTTYDSSVPGTTAKSEPTSPTPSAEIFTLKPNVYGIGVDLKELARRFRAWCARRRGKTS
jgi:hypothetical protein